MKNNYAIYPAIFEKNTDEGFEGYYNVEFPDIPEAFTYAKNFEEAVLNAWEVLGLVLVDADKGKLPKPSSIEVVQRNHPFDFVQLVVVDLNEYSEGVTRIVPKVKKNTTIPADLAKQAEELGINFSSVLTKALRQEINEIRHA
jgi:predicted RNase H-like HicB family nuclease